jgi:hypothetical protein
MTPRRPGWRAVLAAVVVGLLVAWTASVRLGPTARDTVWAEDGGLFFREHLALGSVGSLLHPYAGYLHLGPRLVVNAAFLLPVEWYALAVSTTCCALVGGVGAAVFVLAREVVPVWPLRLVLAAVPVLLPTAPWEITGNAANLHTFGLFLAPWLFAYRVRSWPGATVLALVTVLVVATEAQAVLFLPLLVLSWAPRTAATGLPDRGRAMPSRMVALPVTVAALVAAAAQVVTALTTERESAPGDPTVRDVVSGFLAQTVGGLWQADVAAVGRAVVAHGWAVVAVPVVVLGVVLVLAVAVAVARGHRRTAVMVVALALSSGVVWTAALVANASANGHWSRSAPTALLEATPSRYAAAAGLLLTAALVVAAAVLVDGPVRRLVTPDDAVASEAAVARDGEVARDAAVAPHDAVASGRTGGAARPLLAAVGWCVVALVVTSWVTNLPGTAQRSGGPTWRPQFVDARVTCRAEPDTVLRIRAQPWSSRVPCALVLRDR